MFHNCHSSLYLSFMESFTFAQTIKPELLTTISWLLVLNSTLTFYHTIFWNINAHLMHFSEYFCIFSTYKCNTVVLFIFEDAWELQGFPTRLRGLHYALEIHLELLLLSSSFQNNQRNRSSRFRINCSADEGGTSCHWLFGGDAHNRDQAWSLHHSICWAGDTTASLSATILSWQTLWDIINFVQLWALVEEKPIKLVLWCIPKKVSISFIFRSW